MSSGDEARFYKCNTIIHRYIQWGGYVHMGKGYMLLGVGISAGMMVCSDNGVSCAAVRWGRSRGYEAFRRVVGKELRGRRGIAAARAAVQNDGQEDGKEGQGCSAGRGI